MRLGTVNLDEREQVGQRALTPPSLPWDGVLPATVYTDFVSATTTGTAEEVVKTYTLPANSIRQDGRGFRIRVRGTTASNGNDKTVKIVLGSTTLLSTGNLAANAKDWELTVECWRVTSATHRSIGWGQFNAAIVAVDYVAGTEDFTTALALAVKITDATALGGTTVTMVTIEAL